MIGYEVHRSLDVKMNHMLKWNAVTSERDQSCKFAFIGEEPFDIKPLSNYQRTFLLYV